MSAREGNMGTENDNCVALIRLTVDPETVAQTLMHDFINKYLLGENSDSHV
jgi:hypothetical protein